MRIAEYSFKKASGKNIFPKSFINEGKAKWGKQPKRKTTYTNYLKKIITVILAASYWQKMIKKCEAYLP